jgi:hypothetical protein
MDFSSAEFFTSFVNIVEKKLSATVELEDATDKGQLRIM